MTTSVFNEIKGLIIDNVKHGRIRQAIELARIHSEGAMEWELSDALNAAEDAYRRMLSFAVSGAEDPGRQQMVDEIGETILTITDRLERKKLLRDEPSLYYNVARYIKSQSQLSIASELERYAKMLADNSLIDILAAGTHTPKFHTTASERELVEREIFNLVWTAFPMDQASFEALQTAFKGGVLPPHAVGLFAWALVMGGLQFYDPRKVMLLCDLYDNSDQRVSAIALVGLLLILYHWRHRKFSKKLADRFAALRETPTWSEDVKLGYMELTRTRDTDRISAKIRDEIVPQMMKMRPDIERKFQAPGASTPASLEELEENPEWQELLDKSGIADKLKEMSEIQEEGGDVMMGTFAHLKQFPFFNEIANWFVLFHNERSEFSDPDLQRISAMFETLKFMCDSDKYSMMMSLSQVPAAQRQMMLGQLNAQAEQFEELRASSLDLPSASRREQIACQVRNLYRFFRLFRRKGEFFNPFAGAINLAIVPALAKDVRDVEMLELVAEFYFRHGYWSDALDVFKILEKHFSPAVALYQKMGYALQKIDHIEAALNYYRKADMLDAKSPWTLKHLARVLEQLGNYEEAVAALNRYEELRPDLPATSLAMARSLIASHRYADAVNALYKAFYLDDKSPKVLRPLAWSLMMERQFDQSRKYYERILTEFDPTTEDYLNMGHLSLATGRLEEAQNFYRLSLLSRPQPDGISGCGVSHVNIELFTRDLARDTPELIRIGIDPSLIPLVTDAVLYALQ